MIEAGLGYASELNDFYRFRKKGTNFNVLFLLASSYNTPFTAEFRALSCFRNDGTKALGIKFDTCF